MDLKRDLPKYPNQHLSFEVDITPSINHMYIGRTRKLTKKAERYIQDTQNRCAEEMRKQKWKKDKDNVWYYMDLYFYFPDLRIRDSHNCIKLLIDSLQGLLYKNDYFVMPRVQYVGLDREDARIEVEFFPRICESEDEDD